MNAAPVSLLFLATLTMTAKWTCSSQTIRRRIIYSSIRVMATFKDQALEAGVGFNGDGETQSNMGVAFGDYDGDGRNDLLITTFSQDYFPLFRQERAGLFVDVSNSAGLRSATGSWLGWACGFADFDNDGYRDLWIANGHVYPGIDHKGISNYFEPIAIFRNRQGHFTREVEAIPSQSGNSYRGGASGDFDNDGRVDLVVLPISGSPVLLANKSERAGQWIGFQLHGRKSNRDGIGSKITLRACGTTQTATVSNGSSYLSRNDPRVHFGINDCTDVDEVSIRWPSGQLQTLNRLRPGHYVTVSEPEAK